MRDKEKRNAWARAHYAANIEKYRERDRARFAKDPEKARSYSRKYQASNREKVRASQRAYKASHSEEVKAKNRAHARAVYAARAVTIASHLKERAKLLRGQKNIKAGSTLTGEELLTLWHCQNGLCAISGLPMTHTAGRGQIDTNVSVDRIDPGKGYTLDNIRLVCRRANAMRSNMTDERMLLWCRAIVATASVPPTKGV